jgi:hypothetical protein
VSATTLKRSITVTRLVEVPQPINFVQIDGTSVDIGSLDDATVQAIGKAWAEQLVEHATARRLKLIKAPRTE